MADQSRKWQIVLRRNGRIVKRSLPRTRENAIKKAKELRVKLTGPADVTVEKVEVEGRQVWPTGKKKKAAQLPLAPAAAPPYGTPAVGSTLDVPFTGDEAQDVIDDLPVGSLFVLYQKGKHGSKARRFYMKSTGIGSRQLTLKGFRPVETSDKITAKAKKGIVIEEGTGTQLSFSVASGRVDDWRAVSSPTSSSSSSSGSWWGGGGSGGSGWAWGPSSTPSTPSKPYVPPKPVYSTGGVLINDEGKVLLRQPMNFFDNYAWTFAKGRVDPGETDEEAALREVLEETGWIGEIVETIPGEFLGGTTKNVYFLMRPVRMDDTPEDPDVKAHKRGPREGFKYPHWETNLLIWVTQEEARERINETQNLKGRTRDLQVLDAAYALWNERKATTGTTEPKTNRYRRRRRNKGT